MRVRAVSEKDIVRVLAAVRIGARTSRDVEAMTGIPMRSASAWLSVLAKDGLVRRVRTDAIQYGPRGRGRIYNEYAA